MHSTVDRDLFDDNNSDRSPRGSGRPDGHPGAARDQAFYDKAFRELVAFARDGVLPERAEKNRLGGYVERIAGSVFCGAGIDPSVVRFATSRAADQWGRDEDEVDVMVGDRLLRTTAALMADLR